MEYKQEEKRIAVYDNGREVGEVTWTNAGDSVIIDHTYVDVSQRGKGIAAELVRLVVEMAKVEGYTIVPLCSYAKYEFDRKPEYQRFQAGKR